MGLVDRHGEAMDPDEAMDVAIATQVKDILARLRDSGYPSEIRLRYLDRLGEWQIAWGVGRRERSSDLVSCLNQVESYSRLLFPTNRANARRMGVTPRKEESDGVRRDLEAGG